ncbi:MAG: hypothetical protein WCQ53_04120 [bacterium]
MRFVLILSILFSMSSIHAQQTTAVDRFFNNIVEKHPEYKDKIDAVKDYLKSKKPNAKAATIGVTRYAGDFSARYLITDAGIALYCVPRATEDYYTGTGSRQQGWLTGISPRDGETFDRNPFTANGLNKINPMEGTYRIRLRGGEPVLLVSFIEEDQLEEIWKTYGPKIIPAVTNVLPTDDDMPSEVTLRVSTEEAEQFFNDLRETYLPENGTFPSERASNIDLVNEALKTLIIEENGDITRPHFVLYQQSKDITFELFAVVGELINDPDDKYNLKVAEKISLESQLKKLALLMVQNSKTGPYPTGLISQYPLFYTDIVLSGKQKRNKGMEAFLLYFAKAVNELDDTPVSRMRKRYAVELKTFYEKFLEVKPESIEYASDLVKTVNRIADEASTEALNKEAPVVPTTKEPIPGPVTHLSAADWTDEQIETVLASSAKGKTPELLNNYFMDAYADKIKVSSDTEYKKKNILRFSSLVEDMEATKIDLNLLAKYKNLLSKMHEGTLVSFDFFELQSYVRTYQKSIDETVGLALEKMAANFDWAAKNILLNDGLYKYLYYDKSRALDFILVSALLLSNGNKLSLTVDELGVVGTLFDKKMYPDRYSPLDDPESKDGYGYKLPSYLEGIDAFKTSIKSLKLSK